MFFFLDIYIIQSGLLITLFLQCSLLIKETLPLVKVSETANKGSTVPTKDVQTFFSPVNYRSKPTVHLMKGGTAKEAQEVFHHIAEG